ncbi:MAG: hypothetical protein V1645_02110 [archaeon]
MKDKEFFGMVAKDVLGQQGYTGPSVAKPKVVMRDSDIADVMAGNLRIVLYEGSKRELTDRFHEEVSKAKELGLGLKVNEHFVTQGSYFVGCNIPMCWYIAATNHILPEH